MLAGEYQHTLDAKGRVFLPAKFRGDLSGNLLVIKGLDNCLVLYNEEQWEFFVKKLETFGEMKMKKIKRYLLSSAFMTEQDSQGRIVIPQNLREYAGIEKGISFVGLNNCVEIWCPDNLRTEIESDDPGELRDMLTEIGF